MYNMVLLVPIIAKTFPKTIENCRDSPEIQEILTLFYVSGCNKFKVIPLCYADC